MALVVSGSDSWVALPSPAISGIPHLVVGIFLGIFALGSCTGWFAHRLWLWVRGFRASTQRSSTTSWTNLVKKALRFTRKRRLIALAFSNYRNSDLRNSEGSRPNTLRRRRVATPVPKAGTRPTALAEVSPLREGPVHDGSNRGGTR